MNFLARFAPSARESTRKHASVHCPPGMSATYQVPLPSQM
jgi:hypothetical protein